MLHSRFILPTSQLMTPPGSALQIRLECLVNRNEEYLLFYSFIMTVISQFLLFLFMQTQMNKDKITMKINKVKEIMRGIKEPERLQ